MMLVLHNLRDRGDNTTTPLNYVTSRTGISVKCINTVTWVLLRIVAIPLTQVTCHIPGRPKE